jgi:predicted metal-binding membrane protein
MNCADISVDPQRLRAAPDSRAARTVSAGLSLAAFVACAAATVWSCKAMSAMGEMPMPGGWAMSTIWIPTCGQTWLGAAGAFVRMWTLMMVAMMLPSSMPEWRLWGQWSQWPGSTAAARPGTAAWSALRMIVCYLLAWAAAGAIVFAAGNGLATNLPRAAALARLVPLCSGIVVIVAGAIQFTSWKARRLACGGARSLGAMHTMKVAAAGRLGFRLALDGGCCCANLMGALLVAGMMDLRTMAAATAAMTLERLLPAGGRTARGIGAALIAAGLYLIAQAAGLHVRAIG